MVAARYHRFSIENARILRDGFEKILNEYAAKRNIHEHDKKKIKLRDAAEEIIGKTRYDCKIDVVIKHILSNDNQETGEVSLGVVEPTKDPDIESPQKKRPVDTEAEADAENQSA